MLQLLEQRVGGVRREVVAGQQQHRQPVDRRQGRTRDQVGGARADRRRHRLRGQAVQLPGVADRRVHHGLLVAALVERHDVLTGLHQRLADARHVAVAEDAPGPGDQPAPHAVPLGVLGGQEPHQCLGGRQSAGAGVHAEVSGAV